MTSRTEMEGRGKGGGAAVPLSTTTRRTRRERRGRPNPHPNPDARKVDVGGHSQAMGFHFAVRMVGCTNATLGRPQSRRRVPGTCKSISETCSHSRRNQVGPPVVPRVPILSNRPHLGTTDIHVFSGICFSTYFTIPFILIPIYIGI